MTEQSHHSAHYLVPHTAEQAVEAEKLLHWNWSPLAKKLLTTYPRRKSTHILSIRELERQFIEKFDRSFPNLVNFQRELSGITYPTTGGGEEWATWGIHYVYSPDDFEPGEQIIFNCATYNTSRPDSYDIDPEGKLWYVVTVAESAQIEIERIAFDLLVQTQQRSGYRVSLSNIRGDLTRFFIILDEFLPNIGWHPYFPGRDRYKRIYYSSSGELQLSHAFERDDFLFMTYFTELKQEAEAIYEALSQITPLPPLNFQRSFYQESFYFYADL